MQSHHFGNEAQNHSIISKFNNRNGAVRGHAVVCVERVEQRTQDTTLWGSYVQESLEDAGIIPLPLAC